MLKRSVKLPDGQRERNIRAAGPAECEETRKSGNAGVNKEKAKVTIEKREAIMYNPEFNTCESKKWLQAQ